MHKWVTSHAGVAESADARDSKSRGINFPCGFKSHLRYLQLKDLRQFDVSPFFIDGGRVAIKVILLILIACVCEGTMKFCCRESD